MRNPCKAFRLLACYCYCHSGYEGTVAYLHFTGCKLIMLCYIFIFEIYLKEQTFLYVFTDAFLFLIKFILLS